MPSDPAAWLSPTCHQQMLAEIEAALCAADAATAAVHVRLANNYARRCSDAQDLRRAA